MLLAALHVHLDGVKGMTEDGCDAPGCYSGRNLIGKAVAVGTRNRHGGGTSHGFVKLYKDDNLQKYLFCICMHMYVHVYVWSVRLLACPTRQKYSTMQSTLD